MKLHLSKAYTEAEERLRVDLLERKLRAQPPGAGLAMQPQAQRAGRAGQEAPGLAGRHRLGGVLTSPRSRMQSSEPGVLRAGCKTQGAEAILSVLWRKLPDPGSWLNPYGHEGRRRTKGLGKGSGDWPRPVSASTRGGRANVH